MPTIKFKLKDAKYCNGCEYLSYFYTNDCYFCENFKAKVMKASFWSKILYFIFGVFKHKIKRPQSCIDKFGE